MKHSYILDALSPNAQAGLAVVVIGAALAYAVVRGRVFLFLQPTRERNPVLFYLGLCFFVVILIISVRQLLRI